jgi:hypothetical protein
MQKVDVLLFRRSIQLTPGRHKLVASQMLALMNAEERRLFGEAAQSSMDAADRAESLAAARHDQKKNVYGEEAKQADLAADAVLSLIDSTLGGYARIYESGTPEGDAARSLYERFLPGALKGVSQAAFADELIKLERIVAAAGEPSLAKTVALVPGLAKLLEELAARTLTYRAALDRQAKVGVSYQELRAATEASERRLLELLVLVFGHYRGDSSVVANRRSELLEPYVVLMNDLRERYHRRLPPGEVDSETGELVEEEPLTNGAPEPEPA